MNTQIQRANDRADQLIAEMQKANSIPNQAQQGNTGHQPPTPVESFAGDLAPQKVEHQDADQGDLKQQLAKLQQKYDVLDGKYRSEVPKLHSIIRDQKQKIQGLESKVTETQQQSASYFGEIAEEFGDETANKLQTSIERLLADKIPNQTAQNRGIDESDQMKERYVVDRVGGQEAFDKIDNDPKFIAWLDQFDSQTGTRRRQLLVDHFDDGRLNECAEMYLTWFSQQRQPQKQPNSSTQQILEEQLQPGSVKNTSQQQSSKKTYSMSEYRQISSELVTNKYYSKTEEGRKKAAAIQDELDAAFHEGRIRMDSDPDPIEDPYKFTHS